MATLPAEVRASYVVIIDDVLASSDLSTISAKQVRRRLQEAVEYDITPQKEAINSLIKERFDKILSEQDSPQTNGHETNGHETNDDSKHDGTYSPNGHVSHKRKSDSDAEAEESEVAYSPPPKKKRKPVVIDTDAALAARLQAEENSRARPTRGGATRKVAPIKKKSPKKKTASKVRGEDDSDIDDASGAERKVNRSGGFHKPLILSAPLSALLDGETQMSRPQCVKRIWAYVRERDLQDPKDKRQIRCDDALRAVFKSDKVHMFTMNKILTQNLYDPEA